VRLRKGQANTQRGIVRFAKQSCGQTGGTSRSSPTAPRCWRSWRLSTASTPSSELTIRDLKDQALAHFPSGQFNANSAWTVIAAIAHNLLHWTRARRRVRPMRSSGQRVARALDDGPEKPRALQFVAAA
jgi:hypothetical protein